MQSRATVQGHYCRHLKIVSIKIFVVHTVFRLTVRKNYIRTFHEFHLEVKGNSEKSHIKHRTVDDAVRYLSFFFAASNALDKTALLANVVCNSPWVQKRCSHKWAANAEAWFGL